MNSGLWQQLAGHYLMTGIVKTTHNICIYYTYHVPHKYVILNLNHIASRPNDTKSYLQILSNALGILENILLKIIEVDNYNQV